ncbi:MAG: DNA translocase FtsK 4TM domain-containing protein, partial [Planctomycetota bacterium]
MFFATKKPVEPTSPRNWFWDAVATGMLFFGFALGIAMLGQDPSFPTQYELPGTTSKNPLGPLGTWISSSFFKFLGLSSFFILGTWFTLVFGLLLRNHPLTWILRLAGWLTLIPAASVIATINQDFLPMVSPAGSGGSLGALLFLESRNIIPESLVLPIAIVIALAASFLALPAVWNTLGFGLQFVLTNLLKLLVSITRLFGSILRLFKNLLPIKTDNQTDSIKIESKELVIEKPVTKARAKTKEKVDDGIPIFHHEKFNAKQENKAAALLVNTTSEKYELPPMSLLEDPKPLAVNTQEQDLRDRAVLLEKTFLDFGLNIKVVGINTGPVITQFELALETGLRVNKVTRMNDDISLNLKVPSVRIVAPIPGKNTVGVEIPNEIRAEVRLKEVLQSTGPRLKSLKIPLFLGKDSEGRPLVYDLADMPHLLIAGSTGTGKSVCMNTIILSMLMTR